MSVVRSLQEVEISVFPPKVLLLLSRYARRLKRHNGFVLRLNTRHVLKDLHDANILAASEELQAVYDEILLEVNVYLAEQEGRMLMNDTGSL